MRVVRMEIPMNFTMEYLRTITFFIDNDYSNHLVRGLPFFRNDGGMPQTNTVSFF
jgi:hypothetical protein